VVRSRGGFHDAVMGAFPHLDTLIAYRLLFGIYSGIVPDGIADLVTGDIDWAGDSTILLSYVKGCTAEESLNLPRPASLRSTGKTARSARCLSKPIPTSGL
jgi:hypothetical protein